MGMNTFIHGKIIECMRRQAVYLDVANRCQRIAETTGLSDEEVLPRVRNLGLTPEQVILAHLAPLVQIAWADGRVSDRERTLLINVCRALGGAEGGSSSQQLNEWLDKRPSEAVFKTSLQILKSVIQVLPPENRRQSRIDILSLCVSVSEASGGIAGYLGGQHTSHEEQKLIKRIAETIHDANRDVVASEETTSQKRVA